MSRGVLLIVPSRSDGRVARPLVSGTAGQRPRSCLPSDADPRRWRDNPLQGTRGIHIPPHGSTCTGMVPCDEERRVHAAGDHKDNERKKHEGLAM